LVDRILVALGGNAIKQADEKGTTEEQFRNCQITCEHLAKIVSKLNKDDRLIITHGNGPQAGNLLVQQEAAKSIVPAQTMDIVGAMTQGQIGYMMQDSLANYLKDMEIDIPVTAVVNQVLVDKNDPEFTGDVASKPVGNFFTEEEAMQLKKEHPEYIIKKIKPQGEKAWRRTVPSPDPIKNIQGPNIRKIVDAGFVVIASGGGGIPTILDEKGHYKGVEAVIDKDLAGERLAEVVGANAFLILTDAGGIFDDFNKPDRNEVNRISLSEVKKDFANGRFQPGTMGPKVNACIRFLEWGGEKAMIGSLYKAVETLEGKAGTTIYKD
jgi:carbamate kinase